MMMSLSFLCFKQSTCTCNYYHYWRTPVYTGYNRKLLSRNSFSSLLPLCGGIYRSHMQSAGDTWCSHVLNLNKLLNKELGCWWFETPWRSCDVIVVTCLMTTKLERKVIIAKYIPWFSFIYTSHATQTTPGVVEYMYFTDSSLKWISIMSHKNSAAITRCGVNVRSNRKQAFICYRIKESINHVRGCASMYQVI